jgi:hypothetical protein
MDAASGQGRGGTRAAARHALELPITFGGGAGVTRLVSREEVRFATPEAVRAGQRLTGTLHVPGADGAAGIVLRYVARVTSVGRSAEPGRPVEVSARFEALDFALPEPG